MTEDKKAIRLLSGKYCGNCLFGRNNEEKWNCTIEEKITGESITTEKYDFCRFWQEDEIPVPRSRMTIG